MNTGAMANETVLQYLAEMDPCYDAVTCMVGQPLHGPGYHTTLRDGTLVHSTVLALDYAIALLAAGRGERAAGTVEAVLNLQDTSPANRTYGIWPWFLEESLEEMSPPDWNWADFCGARLLVILHLFEQDLDESLRARIRKALGHAAEAIIHRNVGPGYTNIALMGGTVTAAAGEVLGEERLLTYGRERLQRLVSHTQEHGSFNEYNSPTYTMVALEEAERALHLVRDPLTREAAEWLRAHAWQVIAEHWHPATGQWAGPHSRAYSDRLSHVTLNRLSERLGFALPCNSIDGQPQRRSCHVLPTIPCPEIWRDRFRMLPPGLGELRRRFVKGSKGDVCGTTWFDDTACLGSVSSGTFWTQCRPLLGYWVTPDEPAVVFRARFLHDGRDFATAIVSNRQDGGTVFSTVQLQAGLGDFHPSLDKPADGCFPAEDFRLRFELSGQGASVISRGVHTAVLKAGDREIVVELLGGDFSGVPPGFELEEEENRVCSDVVCYHGPRRVFAFPELSQCRIETKITLRKGTGTVP